MLARYDIKKIPNATAQAVVVREHYLHRKAPCSVAFGLFDGDELKGVVMYGTPSSAPLRRGIAGPEYVNDVAELTRLWVADDVPKNGESFLISNTVKRAGKRIVVSYADTSQNHVGTVYQAANWLYTGLSAKRTNWTLDGVSLHCQTLADKYTAEQIREKYGDAFSLQPRPRKHRYVWLNGSKKEKKQILRALRYPILPYPKRTNAPAKH